MPYEIKAVDGGWKVQNTDTGHFASTRPQTHVMATKQWRLLEMLEHGGEKTGKRSNLDK